MVDPSTAYTLPEILNWVFGVGIAAIVGIGGAIIVPLRKSKKEDERLEKDAQEKRLETQDTKIENVSHELKTTVDKFAGEMRTYVETIERDLRNSLVQQEKDNHEIIKNYDNDSKARHEKLTDSITQLRELVNTTNSENINKIIELINDTKIEYSARLETSRSEFQDRISTSREEHQQSINRIHHRIDDVKTSMVSHQDFKSFTETMQSNLDNMTKTFETAVNEFGEAVRNVSKQQQHDRGLIGRLANEISVQDERWANSDCFNRSTNYNKQPRKRFDLRDSDHNIEF